MKCCDFTQKKSTKIPEGTLRFRPAGGDTMSQTRTALSQSLALQGRLSWSGKLGSVEAIFPCTRKRTKLINAVKM